MDEEEVSVLSMGAVAFARMGENMGCPNGPCLSEKLGEQGAACAKGRRG